MSRVVCRVFIVKIIEQVLSPQVCLWGIYLHVPFMERSEVKLRHIQAI